MPRGIYARKRKPKPRVNPELFEAYSGVTPILIREGLYVKFQGIPHDMTEAEADKICRVIKALTT